MARGWRAWRAKAAMPATSIDVSAWTRQVTLSGPNQPGSPSGPSPLTGGRLRSRDTPRGARPSRTSRTSTGAPTAAQAPAAAPAAVSTSEAVGGIHGSVATDDGSGGLMSFHGDRLPAVDAFAAGRDFLEREGRLLERRLFATLFEGAAPSGVVDALRGYRNADGGFGHGLEPDKRCPDSLAIDVETAFDAML